MKHNKTNRIKYERNKANEKKKTTAGHIEKKLQHDVFPCGPPSQY